MSISLTIHKRTLVLVAATCFAISSVPARSALGHGLHGHITVTGWAIENLPPGDLRDMFQDQDVFSAALTGAMFPDTGYAPTNLPGGRDYAEYSHWEPFIERFIQHVIDTYGPTYETKEEHMLIAFLMGCAAHGLQDELFDSTFLFEIEQRDGQGQDIADPGTDGFLVLDGFFQWLPGSYIPFDEVVPLYEPLGQPIDQELIENHVRVVRSAYVNDTLGLQVAMGYGRRSIARMPWALENYMDPGIAGSLAAEIKPTARHMQALWDRLHNRFDDANLVIHTWPEGPRRVRATGPNDVASWVTMIFGKGVKQHSATTGLVDALGIEHPFRLQYTRWGGTSRLIRFQPTVGFAPGATYSAILEPGAELVDNSITEHRHVHDFQVACAEPDEQVCPPIDITDDPVISVAEPTASSTATATATDTPVPEPTSTPLPSATSTPESTTTATDTATPTPTGTPTLTPTTTESQTPTPTPTITPTPTPARTDDGDGCQVVGAPPTGMPWLPLLFFFAMARARLRHR